MDNLRGLMGIRRMDRVPNARKWQLCGVTKGLMKVYSSGSVPYGKDGELHDC